MRTPLYIANWKMHKTVRETANFIEEFVRLFPRERDREVVICPPFTALAEARAVLPAGIGLGAQDFFWEEQGAFTGEVSAAMLKDLGCSYALVAHSERRRYFGETDQTANQKLLAALEHGIAPVLCVGETASEMEKGKTREVLLRQVREGLAHAAQSDVEKIAVAYEPVWAIGTGKADTPEQSNETIGFIRECLADLAGHHAALRMRILYGGSVNPVNTASFMAKPHIDGVLVGGASLDPAGFAGIVRAGIVPA